MPFTATIAACSLKRDVVFAVDVSERSDTIMDMITPFVWEVIQGLPVDDDGTRVGLMAYSQDTTVIANLQDFQVLQIKPY